MATERPTIETGRRFTGWHILAAVLFIITGMFAIIEPAVAAIGITLLLGWLLIFGGVAHVFAAFKGGGAKRVFLEILSAVAFLIGGLYILTHPLLAIGTLTALLAVVIFAAGIFDIVSYFRLRREQPSGWMLFNGIVALLLAWLIWSRWPSSSAWAIGTLVGVNLLLTGITRLMVGMAERRSIRHAPV
jgi:uncharacterized membrane protein HdeD (DUF308 family)